MLGRCWDMYEGQMIGGCTEKCWAMPDCKICGRQKCPSGRDPGMAAESDYCHWDCPGYTEDPKPGHYWPGEEPHEF